MAENDEVLGLEAIKEYQDLWQSGLIVGFIIDAKEEFLISLSPEDGWHDNTNGAVPEVLRALGGRFSLDDVETPEDLLAVISYYKSYTNALSADEGLSKSVDCTEFVTQAYRLYQKVKIKPILREPVDSFLAVRASEKLDKYRDRILQMDGSLSAKAEPFESIPVDERESTETTSIQNNEYAFVREEDYWDITFEKQKLKPIKHHGGFVYIQHLLQNPGNIVGALDLSLLNNPAPPLYSQSTSNTSDLKIEENTSVSSGDAGDSIDNLAKKTSQKRLNEIPKEINEAERNDDTKRAKELRDEEKDIEHYLRGAIGLYGRSRKLDNIDDKPRSAVTKAINRAYTSLESKCPELVAHLKKNSMGAKFSYNPEQKINWKT